MNIPKKVNQAVFALWATLAISAIVAAIDHKSGTTDSGKFMFYLIIDGLSCILPYKISKGSNSARYIFTVLTVISFLVILGGETTDMTKLDLVLSAVFTPVYLFIFYCLFSSEANYWFSQAR